MDTHFIVVTTNGGIDGPPYWDIEHPSGCPMVEVYDGVFDYECSVGRAITSMGLDAFGTWNEWPEDIPREPGKYPIEYWSTSCYYHYYGTWEYDEGLRLSIPRLIEER